MAVISVDTAMQHVRAYEADRPLVQAYLDAAEEAASRFIGRALFVDAAALAAGKSAIPGLLTQARADYDAALTAAALIEHAEDRERAIVRAGLDYSAAVSGVERIADGMVITPAITAACLLICGHLFANREDVVVGVTVAQLPMGSEALLLSYRANMGV